MITATCARCSCSGSALRVASPIVEEMFGIKSPSLVCEACEADAANDFAASAAIDAGTASEVSL